MIAFQFFFATSSIFAPAFCRSWPTPLTVLQADKKKTKDKAIKVVNGFMIFS